MADAFRADGKIYVVIAVLGIIFVGLVTYLIYLDKKISRLEKRNRE
jgi:CcmD family protein